VAQKFQSQIQAGAFAVVAVVGDSHGTSCVLPVTPAVLGNFSQKTTAVNAFFREKEGVAVDAEAIRAGSGVHWAGANFFDWSWYAGRKPARVLSYLHAPPIGSVLK
jgi:hypothetical protein